MPSPLREMSRVDPKAVDFLVYGSTVVINTVKAGQLAGRLYDQEEPWNTPVSMHFQADGLVVCTRTPVWTTILKARNRCLCCDLLNRPRFAASRYRAKIGALSNRRAEPFHFGEFRRPLSVPRSGFRGTVVTFYHQLRAGHNSFRLSVFVYCPTRRPPRSSEAPVNLRTDRPRLVGRVAR
jgi:hypothetical protein